MPIYMEFTWLTTTTNLLCGVGQIVERGVPTPGALPLSCPAPVAGQIVIRGIRGSAAYTEQHSNRAVSLQHQVFPGGPQSKYFHSHFSSSL